MAQQSFRALNLAGHFLFGFLQGFFALLRHLLVGNRIGVVVFFDLLIDQFFLLLNIPQIAQVAAIEQLFLAHQRE